MRYISKIVPVSTAGLYARAAQESFKNKSDTTKDGSTSASSVLSAPVRSASKADSHHPVVSFRE